MRSPLGEFLRARRQATLPGEVGLPRGGGQRRTPGLRRDEVAMLAGVSTDYYVRLEQGRECRPSDQVVSALARVLQLGPDATQHLHNLAHPLAAECRSAGKEDQVNPDVLQIMESWRDKLAVMVNRSLEVLVHNSLFATFHREFEYTDNITRLTFLEPSIRDFWMDWEEEAASVVAHLRAAAGPDCDPAHLELVEELSRESEDFCRLWARHDVQMRTVAAIRVRHYEVGDLVLRYQAFSIDSAPGQKLMVLQADPDSPSERALGRLVDLAAGCREFRAKERLGRSPLGKTAPAHAPQAT